MGRRLRASLANPWRPWARRALGALFAPEASYSTAPFEHPYRGLAAIAAMWQAERRGPDEPFTMATEVVAVDAERRTGVLRVEVRYGEPAAQTYRDLWIVRFDGPGRCEHFEEWPFWPSGSRGSYPRGPSPVG